MSPKRKNSIVPRIEDVLVSVAQKADNEPSQTQVNKADSCFFASEEVVSVCSSPFYETVSPRMTRRNSPCLACIDHLISWLPSDGGVMFCEEGNGSGTCARCESGGLECKSSRGTVKKPANRLHTALSMTIRDPDTIKPLHVKVRENLKAKKDHELEETQNHAIDEIGDKMGAFLKGMCRDQKLKGFERGIELASITVKDCKGSCSSLLRGCAMGTKATMHIAYGDNEENESPMPVGNGKKSVKVKV